MRIEACGYSIEVPEDWTDGIAVSFMAPRVNLGAPLSPKAQSGSPGNLVLTSMPHGGESASDFVARRVESLKSSLPGFRLVRVDDAGREGDLIPYVEFQYGSAPVLSQVILVRQLGDRFVVLTGTAFRESYEGLREVFLRAARDLGPVRQSG